MHMHVWKNKAGLNAQVQVGGNSSSLVASGSVEVRGG